MSCHVCQAEAVTRCHGCGNLICDEHGGKDDLCTHCGAGIVAGDPRTRISTLPLGKQQAQHGWWRPQQAAEYAPPACYECQSLSRAVCRNCLQNYCREHAGANGLCKGCMHSANLGLYLFAGLGFVGMIVMMCQWLFGR